MELVQPFLRSSLESFGFRILHRLRHYANNIWVREALEASSSRSGITTKHSVGLQNMKMLFDVKQNLEKKKNAAALSLASSEKSLPHVTSFKTDLNPL